jgi:hypothetical protein
MTFKQRVEKWRNRIIKDKGLKSYLEFARGYKKQAELLDLIEHYEEEEKIEKIKDAERHVAQEVKTQLERPIVEERETEDEDFEKSESNAAEDTGNFRKSSFKRSLAEKKKNRNKR